MSMKAFCETTGNFFDAPSHSYIWNLDQLFMQKILPNTFISSFATVRVSGTVVVTR